MFGFIFLTNLQNTTRKPVEKCKDFITMNNVMRVRWSGTGNTAGTNYREKNPQAKTESL